MDPRRRFFLRGQISQARAVAPPPAPPRPPWTAADDAVFTARCTRCGDCVRACPRQLIHIGDGGFPEISFAQQGCDACGDCSRACPSGAIAATTAATAVTTAAVTFTANANAGPGVPAFRWCVAVKPHCLAQQRVECRICADACDARALRFVPALGGISQLRIDTAACTGCGDCVAPCPVGAIEMTLPEAPHE